VSTAEITSLSKRILTAERPGCIGGRPAPGRGPPGLLFFLVATLVLPCFGGGILENGTETQNQEQYRPQVNDVRWKRRSLPTLIPQRETIDADFTGMFDPLTRGKIGELFGYHHQPNG
jgi:hypothetical protein